MVMGAAIAASPLHVPGHMKDTDVERSTGQHRGAQHRVAARLVVVQLNVRYPRPRPSEGLSGEQRQTCAKVMVLAWGHASFSLAPPCPSRLPTPNCADACFPAPFHQARGHVGLPQLELRRHVGRPGIRPRLLGHGLSVRVCECTRSRVRACLRLRVPHRLLRNAVSRAVCPHSGLQSSGVRR